MTSGKDHLGLRQFKHLLGSAGLGTLLGARVLAEIGNDRSRFADASALKSYTGSAPITRAAGRKPFVGCHAAAERRLLNRFLGQLHHGLQTWQHFDEQRAFAPLFQAAT